MGFLTVSRKLLCDIQGKTRIKYVYIRTKMSEIR